MLYLNLRSNSSKFPKKIARGKVKNVSGKKRMELKNRSVPEFANELLEFDSRGAFIAGRQMSTRNEPSCRVLERFTRCLSMTFINNQTSLSSTERPRSFLII